MLPPPQSASLCPRPVACKLLLVFHPAENRKLSWPVHAAGLLLTYFLCFNSGAVLGLHTGVRDGCLAQQTSPILLLRSRLRARHHHWPWDELLPSTAGHLRAPRVCPVSTATGLSVDHDNHDGLLVQAPARVDPAGAPMAVAAASSLLPTPTSATAVPASSGCWVFPCAGKDRSRREGRGSGDGTSSRRRVPSSADVRCDFRHHDALV